MAERLGMADNGRCTTLFESSRLFNEGLFEKAGIDISDNYSYRQYLQRSDPSDVVPEPMCSLYTYVKDFDIVSQSSNEEESGN